MGVYSFKPNFVKKIMLTMRISLREGGIYIIESILSRDKLVNEYFKADLLRQYKALCDGEKAKDG